MASNRRLAPRKDHKIARSNDLINRGLEITQKLANTSLQQVVDILPQPFEWVEIPGGIVTLEAGGYVEHSTTSNVKTFFIGKYPITNRQFALFMENGGYELWEYWTTQGVEMLTYDGRDQPLLWHIEELRPPDCPVTGVTWFEAAAFCEWLNSNIDGGSRVRLPTEQEWQRAALGDSGFVFPWGNELPNERFCNCCRNIGKTTHVMRYPDGASPYGVMDMSGNVDEWCLTGWETGSIDFEPEMRRLQRGGSWSDKPDFVRCKARRPGNPRSSTNSCGYRICISSSKSSD